MAKEETNYRKHVNERFNLLENILKENSKIKIVIAGVPKEYIEKEKDTGKIFIKDRYKKYLKKNEEKIDVSNKGVEITYGNDWYTGNNYYIGVGGALLGTGLGFKNAENKGTTEFEEHRGLLQAIDKRVANLLQNYDGRVSIGSIPPYKENVDNREENTIYVWGANAGNYNVEGGQVQDGSGQARIIGPRSAKIHLE